MPKKSQVKPKPNIDEVLKKSVSKNNADFSYEPLKIWKNKLSTSNRNFTFINAKRHVKSHKNAISFNRKNNFNKAIKQHQLLPKYDLRPTRSIYRKYRNFQ